jgi:hypothetical protein
MIVIFANTDEEGYELLDLLGMPFRKREEQDETSNDETAA